MKKILLAVLIMVLVIPDSYGRGRHEHYPPSYYYNDGFNTGYREGESSGAKKGMIATGLIIIGLVVVYEAITNVKVEQSTRFVYRF